MPPKRIMYNGVSVSLEPVKEETLLKKWNKTQPDREKAPKVLLKYLQYHYNIVHIYYNKRLAPTLHAKWEAEGKERKAKFQLYAEDYYKQDAELRKKALAAQAATEAEQKKTADTEENLRLTTTLLKSDTIFNQEGMTVANIQDGNPLGWNSEYNDKAVAFADNKAKKQALAKPNEVGSHLINTAGDSDDAVEKIHQIAMLKKILRENKDNKVMLDYATKELAQIEQKEKDKLAQIRKEQKEIELEDQLMILNEIPKPAPPKPAPPKDFKPKNAPPPGANVIELSSESESNLVAVNSTGGTIHGNVNISIKKEPVSPEATLSEKSVFHIEKNSQNHTPGTEGGGFPSPVLFSSPADRSEEDRIKVLNASTFKLNTTLDSFDFKEEELQQELKRKREEAELLELQIAHVKKRKLFITPELSKRQKQQDKIKSLKRNLTADFEDSQLKEEEADLNKVQIKKEADLSKIQIEKNPDLEEDLNPKDSDLEEDVNQKNSDFKDDSNTSYGLRNRDNIKPKKLD